MSTSEQVATSTSADLNPSTATPLYHYFDRSNVRQGPVTMLQLRKLRATGQITDDTFVWWPPEPNWIQFGKAQMLQKALSETVQIAEDEPVLPQQEQGEEEDIQKLFSRDVLSQPGKEEVEKSSAPESQNKRKRVKLRKKRANTWVYVSNLPPDTTEDQLIAYFSKCGIIMSDLETRLPRVKLYRDQEGKIKGDGSVCYMQQPSVDLAVQVLDESEFAPGYIIRVQPAKFDQHRDNTTKNASQGKNNTKKPKLDDRTKKLRKLEMEQALSWNEEGLDDKQGLKIVILQNVFSPEDFQDPSFANDLERDIVEECIKHGEIKKVTLFEHHPLGVISVKFKSSVAAENCIKAMNERYYNKRKLKVDYWDGKTDYRSKETEMSEAQRIKEFGDWLEQGDT